MTSMQHQGQPVCTWGSTLEYTREASTLPMSDSLSSQVSYRDCVYTLKKKKIKQPPCSKQRLRYSFSNE